ncbi:MAG: hypothetical protein COB53_03780 [Elusimicrobia bacterium]|nr:MAG: hypothetical protein COB53_03780 [Elusimicrobiota bacterium]
MKKLAILCSIAILAILAAAPQAQTEELNNFKTIAASGSDVPEIGKVKASKISFDFSFGNRRRNDDWNRPGRGRDDFGRGRGRGRRGRQEISCSATDKGWEEHWSGHRSRGFNLADLEKNACGKCLGKHGTCNFNCVTEEKRCTARFLAEDGTFSGDVYGDTWPSRWDAEDSALDRCWRRNRGRAGRCELSGRCDNVGRTQSRGRCKK